MADLGNTKRNSAGAVGVQSAETEGKAPAKHGGGDVEGHTANDARPTIIVDQRGEQQGGLWYPRQEGVIKAGDNRYDSPYAMGHAQICQVRDVLKLVFINLQIVRRTFKSAVAAAEAKAKADEGKKDEATLKAEADQKAEWWETLSPEEKAEEEEKEKAKQEAEKKAKDDAMYEEAVQRTKMERYYTKVKLSVYLIRKSPKPRMVDVEELGVLVLFDKFGDKFDGCLYTKPDGTASWDMVEQGLLKVPDPFNFKGVALVKRATDHPATSEPVIYGFARLDLIPDRLKSTDNVLGMREMKDLQAKIAAATKPVGAKLMAAFMQGMGAAQAAPVVNISRLKGTSYYIRQSDAIWQWLGKPEEEKLNFQEFQKALDHLEIYLLEPRAIRLFAECDLTKSGEITISDFQIGLMMNEIIPAPDGLMPIDAFTLFDFNNEGEINSRQFLEIIRALGVKGDEKKMEEVFKAADEDGSGNIDYEEFKNIFVKLVDVDVELKKRGQDSGGLSVLKNKESQQKLLRDMLDKEESMMKEAFKVARSEVEEVLRQRRIARDEVKRKIKEEQTQLKRLEKLTAAFKKQQKEEAKRREARDRAKNKVEEKLMKTALAKDQAALKAQKEANIREQRVKKEADRIKEIKEKGLDIWDLRHRGFKELPGWVYLGKDAQTRLDVLLLLDLSENKLESLPGEGFVYWMNSLRDFNLSHNRLETLPAEIRNLAKLELLNLANNKLVELPPEIGKLTELKHLDLFKNQLATLPPEIGNLNKLRVLNVHSNYITELPLEFANLGELHKLDLGDNRLRYLPDDLSRLMSVTDLDLSGNTINYLPLSFGQDLFNLKFLDLSYNQLGELPDSFLRLNKLQILRANDNQIKELGDFLKGLTSLLELDLSNNLVDTVSKEIGKCVDLQALHLQVNRLQGLPKEVGFLEYLQKLNLRHNRLTAMLPEVGALKSLRDLDLSSNLISGPMPTEFGMMEGIRTVNISFNQVTGLPDSIGNLIRVEYMNASHNKIEDLPMNMRGCTTLKVLNMSGNGLTRFPEVLCEMNLQDLDLSSNIIDYMPRAIHKMAARLERLDLSHNALRSVPAEFSILALKVKDIHLEKNPWQDLPPRWNPKWTPKEQNKSRAGYTSWDVIGWAHEEHCFYEACEAEWAETGALHFRLRASLDDFIQGVKNRLGKKWFDRFKPRVTRLYFLARENGFMPRLHQVSLEEEDLIKSRIDASNADRARKVEVVREQHEDLKSRLRQSYQKELTDGALGVQRVRGRFQKALSHHEIRMQRLSVQRAYEKAELLKVARERAKLQEQRGREKAERDKKMCDEEMARLLDLAQANPFW